MEENIFADLNDEQKDAVKTTEGYVRIVAGAGSGKTKALVYRYVYLVKELGIATANILCVTFTNKAANEMKSRIRSLVGDMDTSYICTFHGFCVKLLREDIHVIDYSKSFIILDTEDTETILKKVYEKNNLQSRAYTFKQAREYIGLRKIRGDQIKYLADLSIEKLKEEYDKENKIDHKIFLGYLYEQRKCYGLDYDDLIVLATYILTKYEDIRLKWQKRLMYIMVDEFQDVNGGQYNLVEILSGYHKNMFIVGDPDQTIYTWRGAHVEFILNFDKNHKNTQTIIMNKNYRSTPEIVDASNSLIEKNEKRIKKNLISLKNSNVKTVYTHSKTTQLEAEWIVNEINNIISEESSKYSDIAILYRAHFVSRSIEEAFIKNKIPYILYSGIEFYKRKEIKDILSYLRMIVYADDLSFQRVINEPKRNFGDKRMAMIQDYADKHECSLYVALKQNLDNELILKSEANKFVEIIDMYNSRYKNMSITDVLEGILDKSGYEAMLKLAADQDRIDNVTELKQSIYDFENSTGEENTIEEYLQDIALFTNIDAETKKNCVKMMTVHTAKGLEFPYVFVCGLNEGIFPSAHVDTKEKMEEERRLAYVAYTRAENALYLSDAEGKNFDGSYRLPSRFIFNTNKNDLKYTNELPENLISESTNYINANEKKLNGETSSYPIGAQIMHEIFGKGKIVGKNNDICAYIVKFEKIKTERNISYDSKLKLDDCKKIPNSDDNNNAIRNFISENPVAFPSQNENKDVIKEKSKDENKDTNKDMDKGINNDKNNKNTFAVGSRVVHEIFGEGTITGKRDDVAVYLVKFDLRASERQISYMATSLKLINNSVVSDSKSIEKRECISQQMENNKELEFQESERKDVSRVGENDKSSDIGLECDDNNTIKTESINEIIEERNNNARIDNKDETFGNINLKHEMKNKKGLFSKLFKKNT